MPASIGTAPGKIILAGEHAVVYGRHAIAVPVSKVQAKASIFPRPDLQPDEIKISAPDIQVDCDLSDLPTAHPFSKIFALVKENLNLDHFPAANLRIQSSIPIAAGMGSGAAVSTAILKALFNFLGKPHSPAEISRLAFEIEKIYHGNPSGIDNTVIAHNQPIFYKRDDPFQLLRVDNPLTFVIADSGVKISTFEMVERVKINRSEALSTFEAYFDQMDRIAIEVRNIIEGIATGDMGSLLMQNHVLLQKIGVSCPELDQLVDTALLHGAQGAKLCGAGGGGNMIALVDKNAAQSVAQALIHAGATNTIITTIPKFNQELF